MININLLPWREIEQKKKIKQFLLQLCIAFLVSFLLCLFFYLNLKNEIFFYQKKIISLERKISVENSSPNSHFMKIISSTTGAKKIDILETKMDENNFLLNTLFFVGENIPSDIYLNSVDKKEDGVQLSGRAMSQESVVLFAKNLEKNFSHKKVSLSEFTTIEEGKFNIAFMISLGANR
ncbi:MAG: hypothetical protein K0Q74_815 [Gammaproteobacteria bacterium]|nr:hypothetical protein [Gammaproteobacteria bacterium]